VADQKIGLALGSGGARGWAHIGVIRALIEAEIKIDYIAGASIGAFVGAFYAAGGLSQLEEYVQAIDWKTIVSLLDLEFPTQGLLDGGKVYQLLQEHLLAIQIEDTAIPFQCVATDLLQKKSVTLKSGSLVDAVRASISIPGIFTPFEKDGVYYIDGGVINPVPVDLVKAMGCDLAIAVNLNHQYLDSDLEALEQLNVDPDSDRRNQSTTPDLPQPEQDNNIGDPGEQGQNTGDANQPARSQANPLKEFPDSDFLASLKLQYESVQATISQKVTNWLPESEAGEAGLPRSPSQQCPNIFDVIGNAINIMEQQVTEVKLAANPPDILIQPNLSQYGIFDFHCADAIIQAGYEHTKSHLAEIKRQLETALD
jgi:NTE family protein